MSSSQARHQSFLDSLPPIRRVFRKGHSYLCGICRSLYSSHAEAHSCVNHCWQEVQQVYPLVQRKLKSVGLVYRCRYCARDYQSEAAGLECAADCLAKRQGRHQVEQRLSDQPLAPRPKRNFSHQPASQGLGAKALNRFQLRSQRPVPVATKPKLRAKAQSSESAQTPTLVDAQPAVDLAAADTPAAPAVDTGKGKVLGRNKADFKKPWRRDNAKYLCCACNKEYFTKVEVQACFDGHFGPDGFEKS